jgi:hypothetical protein
MLTVESKICNHQPVYFGVVNININERTIGSVDVWRCGVCKKRFCEEKQLGIEAIAEIVGMPPINNDEKWDERIVSLKVKNFEVEDDKHWSFLIDEHVNKAVEV